MLNVTPYGGVWIEIPLDVQQIKMHGVTPYGGVWIEILTSLTRLNVNLVTPYGGVWIEIQVNPDHICHHQSRLMEACGLKYMAHRGGLHRP